MHKERLIGYIGDIYISAVLALLAISVVSFVLFPFGDLIFNVGGIWLSSVTVITFTLSIAVLYYIYKEMDVFPRIMCSLVLPIFGISFHEAWWHVGSWYTWGMGFPIFWISYSVALFLVAIILHMRCGSLKFTMPRLVFILVCLLGYRVGWQYLMDTGMFPALLLYEQGRGPNPQGLVLYLNASLGRMVWLLLANCQKGEWSIFKMLGILKGVVVK